MFRKFKFEEDFYDQLKCIPFSTRHKLDLAGVKLSLKSWNVFPEEDRQRFCEMSADGEQSSQYPGCPYFPLGESSRNPSN